MKQTKQQRAWNRLVADRDRKHEILRQIYLCLIQSPPNIQKATDLAYKEVNSNERKAG